MDIYTVYRRACDMNECRCAVCVCLSGTLQSTHVQSTGTTLQVECVHTLFQSKY